eukprot:CAMPEP_0184440896 /NCGR_PEP_ID=MMETSP0738-20130409/755809_1 /TAXON_ID=385413 /ORGANISM="Thalassiosira miniscula, Strain CCMP1093" /LENGTH=235 /DNA_ID=CAMNT_0026808811 /DNA_START=58 /DNA_END=765 /DNA_ORIENTATION=-
MMNQTTRLTEHPPANTITNNSNKHNANNAKHKIESYQPSAPYASINTHPPKPSPGRPIPNAHIFFIKNALSIGLWHWVGINNNFNGLIVMSCILRMRMILMRLVALGRNKQQFQRFDSNELYPEDENDLDEGNDDGGGGGDDHRRPNDPRRSIRSSSSRSRSTKKILNYPLECPCCRQDFVCETVVNLADDETDEHENDNNPNKKMVLLHGEEKEEEEKVEEPEMGLFDGNDDNV